tara:strand:- start:394 stop:633 length:240 start_codon:yes stop_codon:yes gene_type:complete
MTQPYYPTQKDYSLALKQKEKVVDILRKSRRSILMISSKMSDYWKDSYSYRSDLRLEVVKEIEEMIKELNNENSESKRI